MKVLYPNDSSFLCPCSKCRADPDSFGISQQLCEKVNLIKSHIKSEGMDIELFVTSGRRCSEHNAKVGGSPKSQHLTGKAVDFRTRDFVGYTSSEVAYRIVDAAMVWNVPFIEVTPDHIHIDMRELEHPKLIIGS